MEVDSTVNGLEHRAGCEGNTVLMEEIGLTTVWMCKLL